MQLNHFLLSILYFFTFSANAGVSFEREAILSHVRSLKADSERISAEHERFLQQSYREGGHHAHSNPEVREIEERKRQRRIGQLCSGELNLNRILRRVISRNCNLSHIINSCNPSSMGELRGNILAAIEQINASLSAKSGRLDINTPTPHFSLNSLKSDRNELFQMRVALWANLNAMNDFRTQCRTQASEIFSQQCGSSYHQVFDRIVRGSIATNCSPETIDQYANDFIIYMEENANSPVQILSTIQLNYVEVRRTEMEAARVISRMDHFLVELDNFIYTLENRSNAIPLVENSPRPERRRPAGVDE